MDEGIPLGRVAGIPLIGIHSANDGKLDAFLRVVCEELSEACIA